MFLQNSTVTTVPFQAHAGQGSGQGHNTEDSVFSTASSMAAVQYHCYTVGYYSPCPTLAVNFGTQFTRTVAISPLNDVPTYSSFRRRRGRKTARLSRLGKLRRHHECSSRRQSRFENREDEHDSSETPSPNDGGTAHDSSKGI